MSRSEPRLYLPVSADRLTSGAELPLEPGQAHYLGTVMRQAVGSRLRVFNGRDGEWAAHLAFLRKDRGTVTLEACVREQVATRGPALLFAPLKRDATELVVRMGTEMGVTSFYPVVTERTNTHRLNMERLALIAQEAAEQCERLDVPQICPLRPLRALLAEWPAESRIVAAMERRQAGCVTAGAPAALLIGPEGGFSDVECELLLKHPAIEGISLGPLILRAETAACAGLARLACWP